MSKPNNRRKFMMALGLGGAAAATAALTGKGKKSETGVTAGEKGQSKGYQLTEHVRDYYRTCRV
ncbi:MAG TPA: twin-arginine translocation signal domain-containing protein [Burkholderiales bacterium]|nr:twin-arginine translocation signal domain-containing protein [Burkholderiales bacterium]